MKTRFHLITLTDIGERETRCGLPVGPTPDYAGYHDDFTGHRNRCERCWDLMQSDWSAAHTMTPETLISLRTLAGLTQSGLAAYLGVHRTTVARWETGRTPIPPWLPAALRSLTP